MSDNRVTVIHPLTGEVMRLHPYIAANVAVWLPPDPADLTPETIAELRQCLDVPFLAATIARLGAQAAADAEVPPADQ